jgi:glycine betaine/choline ABC-type transport system substrate-binding protein
MENHLVKVKEILWSEKQNSPVFVLEDGRKFFPFYRVDGVIWEELKDK